MTTRMAPGVGANLLGQHSAERNQDATAYVGNLDPQLSEELLWELFVQAGPVVNVYVPKDRVTNLHQGYGFIEFRSEEDADYAIKVLNMIKLYGKPIRVNKDVDEKLLYDIFSAFGVIVTNPKIMRDPESENSRGFGFISYDSFDAAIEAMNGQYLCNRQITVSYAYKKDTKGERHGTPAESFGCKQPKSPEEQAPYLVCKRTSNTPLWSPGQWCYRSTSACTTFCKWHCSSWPNASSSSSTTSKCTLPTNAAYRTSALAGSTNSFFSHASAYAVQTTSTKHDATTSSLLFQGLPHQWEWEHHLFGSHHHRHSKWVEGPLCHKCQCHPLPHLHRQVEDHEICFLFVH